MLSQQAKDFWAGGVGGMLTVFVGQPFDTIKVRLQTMPTPAPGAQPIYTGTLNCALTTIKSDGLFGLYKGMFAPLMGVTPMFAICFYGFSYGKKIQMKSPDEKLTKFQIFKAGMLAGVCTTAIMVPLERVKCLLQVQSNSTGPAKFKGPIDVVRQLYKEGGIRSIYKGTAATLSRDVPGTGMYFASYEVLREALTPEGQRMSVASTLFAGGMAGVLNWSIAVPQDVLKSRLQTAPEGKYPHGLRSVIKDLIVNEGVFALYRGFTPVMLRAFPANAACFLGYEMFMKFLNWLIPPKQSALQNS